MSETQTATVETLTAEVRVLMVGSRQVTLSVAKQLDQVPLGEMEPFGRVALGSQYADHMVIGRHVPDGSLVLAEYRPRDADNWLDGTHLPGKFIVCEAWLDSRARDIEYRLNLGDFEVVVDESATRPCGRDGHHRFQTDKRCAGFGMEGMTAEEALQIVLKRDKAYNGPHRAARTLPLVVLAGLR